MAPLSMGQALAQTVHMGLVCVGPHRKGYGGRSGEVKTINWIKLLE